MVPYQQSPTPQPQAVVVQDAANTGQQQQQQQHHLGNEQVKKFGSKLGNAAIFGAGATIGSKVVNSIF
jgi:hypothetical protein